MLCPREKREGLGVCVREKILSGYSNSGPVFSPWGLTAGDRRCWYSRPLPLASGWQFRTLPSKGAIGPSSGQQGTKGSLPARAPRHCSSSLSVCKKRTGQGCRLPFFLPWTWTWCLKLCGLYANKVTSMRKKTSIWGDKGRNNLIPWWHCRATEPMPVNT